MKRRVTKLLILILFLLTTTVSGCRDILFELLSSDDAYDFDTASEFKIEGPYEVERVVDGDTLIIDIDGARTRVRLIGVNTPESVAPEEDRNTREGVIASDFVKDLIDDTGRKVWLEYDNEILDQYDRTLAYVYIAKDGELIMLERILLKKGLAEAVVFGTNARYYDEFCELEEEYNR